MFTREVIMINGVIKLYQRVCRHDYEYFGVYDYIMSGRSETVVMCRKCAHDSSFSEPLFSSSRATNFTYEP